MLLSQVATFVNFTRVQHCCDGRQSERWSQLFKVSHDHSNVYQCMYAWQKQHMLSFSYLYFLNLFSVFYHHFDVGWIKFSSFKEAWKLERGEHNNSILVVHFSLFFSWSWGWSCMHLAGVLYVLNLIWHWVNLQTAVLGNNFSFFF